MRLKKFTLKESEDNFWDKDVVKRKIMDAGLDLDLYLDRSIQICLNALCTYQHMHEDLKKVKTVQSTLLKHFKRQ
jgi:hypothetical protein